MGRLWHSAAIAALLTAGFVSGEAFTPKHEAGRCAMRGHCGKTGFFSPELPCSDNGLAEEPEDDVRKQLVELCGPKWNTGPVCCGSGQVWCLLMNTMQNADRSCSLTRWRRISRRQILSYPPAPHARRTSTTYSAHLPVLPISRSSSTSLKPTKLVESSG
jgi:hypothetical protein